MFKNKHVIAAVIIAPILSVITYFAVDYVVKEKPHKAVHGQHYPLAAKSNCRYASGRCDLENGDIKVVLRVTNTGGTPQLNLDSNLALNFVKVGLAGTEPVDMKSSNNSQTLWHVPLTTPLVDTDELKMVVLLDNSFYYADVNAVFMKRDTDYSK